MTASADPSAADPPAGDPPVADVSPVTATTATWFALVAVVVGHLGLLVLDPDALGTGPLAAIEAGFLAVVAGSDLLLGTQSRDAVGVLAFAWVVLVGGAVLLTRVWRPWVLALALVVLVALASYALHRIELVALDIVEVTDERE